MMIIYFTFLFYIYLIKFFKFYYFYCTDPQVNKFFIDVFLREISIFLFKKNY